MEAAGDRAVCAAAEGGGGGGDSLFAGVEAMLRTLAENGVQLALVTSDSEANARAKLGDVRVAVLAFRLRGIGVRQAREIPPRDPARRRGARPR